MGTLNCRPGDLAVVVRVAIDGDEAYRKYTRRLIGKVVLVTKADAQGSEVCWTIRNPFWMRVDGSKTLVTGIQDCLLQPIRGDISTQTQLDSLENQK